METDIKENRGTERTDKTKSWFSEKINTIEKLARLVKKKGGVGGGEENKLPISGKTDVNHYRFYIFFLNECYEKPCANKFNNLDEKDKLLSRL